MLTDAPIQIFGTVIHGTGTVSGIGLGGILLIVLVVYLLFGYGGV